LGGGEVFSGFRGGGREKKRPLLVFKRRGEGLWPARAGRKEEDRGPVPGLYSGSEKGRKRKKMPFSGRKGGGRSQHQGKRGEKGDPLLTSQKSISRRGEKGKKEKDDSTIPGVKKRGHH